MITLMGFAGEIPKIMPRLLPIGAAQIAKNCKLQDGSIVPLRYPNDYRVLASGDVMFYKRGSVWFEWNKIVDVVQAPIANNRLYMTGDGVPRIVADSSTVYPLKVAAPLLALTATPAAGTPDPATQYSVVYAYTYVTAYDEESEPSPVSNEALIDPSMDVTLTGFVDPPTDRNYNRIRIYRSQTSSLGVTELFFINEQALPVPTPNWVDAAGANPIQDVIASTDYNPPPNGLTGIIALPNGMLAGFDGKKLYICEPWIPHAWPEKYVQTVDFDIVGLGAFGSSIVIMTTGQPYVCTGISPDAMILERLEVNLPCINKRGIVDLGYQVAYPAPNGLAVISSAGANLVTRDLWTVDQWRDMSPETWVSSQYDGRYIASYSYIDRVGNTQSGTLILDLTGQQPFITRTDLTYAFMFFEIGAGKLYVLNADNVAQEWDSPYQQFMSMTWKSKPFMLPAESNYGAIRVDGNVLDSGVGDPNLAPYVTVEDATLVHATFPSTVVGSGGAVAPGSLAPFQCKIYADGSLKRTLTDFNIVSRLPGGFLARKWEIHIEGQRQIEAIYLAFAPSEIVQGEIQ